MTTITDDILISICPTLGKAKVGWIFPDGSVVEVDHFYHHTALPEKYQARYIELVDRYNEQMEDDLAALEPDEHPAMHRFDPQGDSNQQLLRELADDGFLRFGLWCNADAANLDLDGSKNGVKIHHDLIAYIVAGLDIKNVYLNDVTSYNYKRVRQKQFH